MRSLQKLAMARQIIAGTTARMCVKAKRRIAVERKAQNATTRREILIGNKPLTSEPTPPNSNGSTDKPAARPD